MTTSVAQMAVLRHDRFRLLFLATLGSGIGTWMATIALTADITNRTHSTWWVSALFIVTFLPSVVVGLAAGPLVDRLSRKRLVVGADLVRLVVFVALPFANNAGAMLALAAVAGLANSFFRPAVLAGVPNLVDEADLAAGSSLLQATEWLAAALGPVVGGALVSASGPHVVYWVNAATFLFSAVLLVRIPARLLQSEQGLTRGHWRDLHEGIGEFARSRPLRVALFGFGCAMLAVGLANVSEIFLAERSLHSNAFGYGLMWTGSGIGLVVGTLLTPSAERRGTLRVYPLTFVVWALGALGAAVSPDIWLAALSMVLCGLGNGVAFGSTILIVQRYTVDRLRGRAFTVIISVHNALLGVGMVASALITGAASARWTFAAASACIAAGGVTACVASRRGRTP